MKPNIILKKQTELPLYGFDLILLVAENNEDAQRSLPAIFGGRVTEYADGLAFGCAGSVGILLQRNKLNHDLIGHELFHLTHRVLEICSDKFSPDSHEPYAYLNGWLHSWVYRQLKKARIKVSL